MSAIVFPGNLPPDCPLTGIEAGYVVVSNWDDLGSAEATDVLSPEKYPDTPAHETAEPLAGKVPGRVAGATGNLAATAMVK